MDKKIIVAGVAVVIIAAAVGAILIVRDNNEKIDISYEANGNEGKIVGDAITSLPDDSSRLWVYGNVNYDDKMNSDDISLLKKMISGDEEKNTLADVNGDGVVDDDDVEYLERIVYAEDDTEVDVYYIDSYDRAAKVSWPVNTFSVYYNNDVFVADVTGLCDKVAMMPESILNTDYKKINSAFENATSFGVSWGTGPDYEAIIAKGIDVFTIAGGYDSEGTSAYHTALKDTGIDVMFISTSDFNNIPDIPREITMFGYLLQGDMDKTYDFLEWHDEILGKITSAASTISDADKASVIMSRSSLYNSTSISITGLTNLSNQQMAMAGMDVVAMDSSYTPLAYNNLDAETVLAMIEDTANNNKMIYLDNERDGITHNVDLDDCIAADKTMLSTSPVSIHYLGMDRVVTNTPLYLVMLVMLQNVAYPDLTATTGLEWEDVYDEYFEKFASSDYYKTLMPIDDNYKDYGTA